MYWKVFIVCFRLTPPLMFLMLIYVPLFPYVSDGPFWVQTGFEAGQCNKTWWQTMLYINNFYDEVIKLFGRVIYMFMWRKIIKGPVEVIFLIYIFFYFICHFHLGLWNICMENKSNYMKENHEYQILIMQIETYYCIVLHYIIYIISMLEQIIFCM